MAASAAVDGGLVSSDPGGLRSALEKGRRAVNPPIGSCFGNRQMLATEPSVGLPWQYQMQPTAARDAIRGKQARTRRPKRHATPP